MKFKLPIGSFPTILVIIWFIFVLAYLRNINYFSLSLTKTLPPVSLGLYRGDAILKGDKILIEYNSKYKKLGAISVKFTTYNRINSDILRFRIKRRGEGNWYYEYDYKVNQLQTNDSYAFKFPVITEAQGNSYDIEIESLSGTRDDSVAIASPLGHSVVAQHIFTKEELLLNP